MQHLRDKLRDESGVSILMALFALLVVAMVCIVILTAATSTVRQGDQDRKIQQNLLLLQSAGELVEDGVVNASYSFTTTVTTTTDKDGVVTVSEPSFSGLALEGNSNLNTELSAALAVFKGAIEGKKSASPQIGYFTILSPFNTEDSTEQAAQDVRVDYNIESPVGENGACASTFQTGFELSLNKGAADSQTIYLKMTGMVQEQVVGNDHGEDGEGGSWTSVTTRTTFSWGNPSFTRVESEVS